MSEKRIPLGVPKEIEGCVDPHEKVYRGCSDMCKFLADCKNPDALAYKHYICPRCGSSAHHETQCPANVALKERSLESKVDYLITQVAILNGLATHLQSQIDRLSGRLVEGKT